MAHQLPQILLQSLHLSTSRKPAGVLGTQGRTLLISDLSGKDVSLITD